MATDRLIGIVLDPEPLIRAGCVIERFDADQSTVTFPAGWSIKATAHHAERHAVDARGFPVASIRQGHGDKTPSVTAVDPAEWLVNLWADWPTPIDQTGIPWAKLNLAELRKVKELAQRHTGRRAQLVLNEADRALQ